jgi:hypothetical protein
VASLACGGPDFTCLQEPQQEAEQEKPKVRGTLKEMLRPPARLELCKQTCERRGKDMGWVEEMVSNLNKDFA